MSMMPLRSCQILFSVLCSCLLLGNGTSFSRSILNRRICSHNNHFRTTRYHLSSLQPLKSTSTYSSSETISNKPSFDLQLALLLAGFSFEAYNERMIGKRTLGLDRTVVTFTSSAFIRNVFSAVLLITLRKGQLSPVASQEEQLAEKLATGSDADPYVTIHIQESPSSASTRVWDSWTSTVQMNTHAPVWNETALVYVRDPSQSYAALTVRDKDMFKSDDYLGSGLISISELLSLTETDSHSPIDMTGGGMNTTSDRQHTINTTSTTTDHLTVDSPLVKPTKPVTVKSLLVPIYSKRMIRKSNIFESLFSKQSESVTYPRVGSVELDLQYVPFQDNLHRHSTKPTNIHTATATATSTKVVSSSPTKMTTSNKTHTTRVMSGMSNTRRLPKGGTDGLDWSSLLQLHSETSVLQFTTAISSKQTDNQDVTSSESKLDNLSTDVHDTDDVKLSSSSQSQLLGQRLTQSILHHDSGTQLHSESGLHQVCFIDNTDTDTQASIWVDFRTKQLVLAFRGTEQIKFKDILTDINLLQVPYQQSQTNTKLNELLIHSGFLTAFQSARDAILQLLSVILTQEYTIQGNSHESNNNDTYADGDVDDIDGHNHNNMESHWTVFVTGHSLGGALATLMTFELSRMAAGLWGDAIQTDDPIETLNRRQYYNPPDVSSDTTAQKDNKSSSSLPGQGDLTAVYQNNTQFMKALKSAHICCYTYGAPRVGNPAFAKLFDELVPHCYRVVNDKDLVARIPRSSQTNRFLQYEHVGRAVVVGNDELGPLHIPSASIISSNINRQSVSSTTTINPTPTSTFTSSTVDSAANLTEELKSAWLDRIDKVDLSALNRLQTEGAELISQWVSSGSRINSSRTEQNMLMQLSDTVLSRLTEGASMEDIAKSLYKSAEGLVSLPDVSTVPQQLSSAVASFLEPETSFIDKEVKLLQSILDGRALEHHMEPSYYDALEKVIAQYSEQQPESESQTQPPT